MAFRERIELVVDVITGQSRGSLKQLSTEVKEADGAFSKLRVGAAGAFDFLKANAGVAALAVGTALVGMGTKAVASFEDATLGAGKLRDALGVTAQEASRLQEVAGDLGIGVEAIESAFGRMNRAAANTPQAFEAIGAAIKRNRDGTVNVVETFLSVVDALDRIPDATQRASAAQQIFGRGWQNIAELVAQGADGVRKSLAGVESQKVFNDKQIDQGRELRDNLDELKGVSESAALVIGGKLAEALNDLLGAGQKVAGFITALEEKIPEGAKRSGISLSSLGSTIGDVAHDFVFNAKVITDTLGLTEKAADDAGEANAAAVRILEGLAPAAERGVSPLLDVAAAHEEMADKAEAAHKFIELVTKAFEAQVEAAENAADQVLDASDAQEKFAEAAAVTNGMLDEHGHLLDQSADGTKKYTDAVDDERDALIDAAKAGRDMAVQQAAAAGQTLNATQKVDAFNRSLEDNAAYATPAAKRAAYEYLVQLNQIPAEKAAEILTLVDQGRLAEANGQIQNASRTRTAAIIADAETTAAENELNRVARLRTAQIQAQVTGARTMGAQLAHGGRAHAGDIAGEAGAELVKLGGRQAIVDSPTIMPEGAMVTPLGTGGAANGAGYGNAAGAGTVNVTINMPPGSNGNDVVRAIRRYERRNGPAWRQ